ncbi:MAG: DUF4340 domain-containing protein [Opitutales bacterium]|nr:DUF4340 domain-containing protein [Opitutales bacterium]
MRFRLTFVLLVLNLVALGFIFFIRMDPGRATFEEAARLVLPAGLVGSADRIEVAGPALDRDWIFTRGSGDWSVESPLAWRANAFAMERLLQQLAHLRWETRFPVSQIGGPEEDALRQYGLDPAKAVIRVVRGAETWEIPVGEATQVGNRLYLLAPDGRDVLVVSRDIFDILASDLTAFFEPLVIRIPEFEARALTVQEEGTGAPRVRISRDGTGPGNPWRFESPLQVPAESETVRRFLERLNHVEVHRFVHDPPEDAFGSGDIRFTLEGNNRRQTVIIGQPVPGDPVPSRRFLRISGLPTVVEVEEEPFAPLFTAQESLRQRRFLDIGDAFPTAIEIILDERTTSLQRLEGGEWQVADTRRGPENAGRRTRRAEREVVERIVRRLAELEAHRFVTEAPSSSDLAERYGLAPPQRAIRLHLPGRNEPLELRLGHLDPEDNLVYARRSGMPTVFKVRPGILGLVPATPLHYRERSLTTLPQAARLSAFRLVDNTNGKTVFARELTERLDSWEALEVAEGLEETGLRDSIETIRRSLRRFTVRDYVAEELTDPLRLDADTEIPWHYRLEAEVRLPGAPGDEPRIDTYHLTERLGGRTQFGGSASANVVFTLTQPLIDALDQLVAAGSGHEPPDGTPPADLPPVDPEAAGPAADEEDETETADDTDPESDGNDEGSGGTEGSTPPAQ